MFEFLPFGAMKFQNENHSAMSRVQQLAPEIQQICNISGTAGASIGILHKGKVLQKANFGFRNVAARTVPNYETIYGIGSITKAFVAAGVGKLIHEQKLTWTTPIKSIIPEWQNVDPAITNLTTIVDCLAHRIGLAGDYSFTFQGDGDALLPVDQLIPLLNAMYPASPFREQWIYSSWGYSLAGVIIERLSGQSVNDFLQQNVYKPLGMKVTTTQPKFPSEANIAEPYSSLEDGTPNHLKTRQVFKDTVFEAAASIFTNVDDMLLWASAIIDTQSSSLKETETILSGQIPMLPPSFRERSYAMGWIRTQLPGVVGLMGDNSMILPIKELPQLGDKSPSILAFYHQGLIVGYYSSIFLFPESQSAIIVLTNSIALCDAAEFIAQAYTQALFDFKDPTDYVDLARKASRRLVSIYEELGKTIEEQRKPNTLHHPLDAYTGRFWNKLHNFVLEVKRHATQPELLQFVFQGLDTQIYDLRHLANDTFEWILTLDQESKRGRYHTWEPEFYSITFIPDGSDVDALRWAANPVDFPSVEIFEREGKQADYLKENLKDFPEVKLW
ncbi:Penicillin-binding protein [Lachnellula occidentalis]|uniref:Penicillin-binding protein n=1 Tax=Lachnellula occidentalis TaxID=215460 RepID=A0A8H8UD15_9HELO|nr:Penicillin-binding protein [Lachnellula occidentalis]